MPAITIDIPNGQVTRILEAFTARYGASTQAQVKARLIEFVKDTVYSHEQEQAEVAARAALAAPPDLT